MILDTNAVSAWWLGDPGLLPHLEEASALHLPVPVLAEFQFGILKSKRRRQMQDWLEEACSVTTILPADQDTARIYADLRLDLETRGEKIPMNDLWIAAIAIQHRLPIASRDHHFSRLPALTLVNF